MIPVAPPLAPVINQILDQVQSELAVVVKMMPRPGMPSVTDWPVFLESFKQPDGRVEGWIVDVDWSEASYVLGPVDEVTVRAKLLGFRGVDLERASRELFGDTVAGIFDAFRRSTLAGLVDILDPVVSRLDQGMLIEDRLLGDLLCHVADLVVTGRLEIG